MSLPRLCKVLIILKLPWSLYKMSVSQPDLWLLNKCGRTVDTSWGFLSNFFFFFFFLTDGVDANFLLVLVIWLLDGFFIRCLLTPGLSSKRWPGHTGREKRPPVCLVEMHCLAWEHIQTTFFSTLYWQSPGSWELTIILWAVGDPSCLTCLPPAVPDVWELIPLKIKVSSQAVHMLEHHCKSF